MNQSRKQFRLPPGYTREHAITLAGSVNIAVGFDAALSNHTENILRRGSPYIYIGLLLSGVLPVHYSNMSISVPSRTYL